MNVITLPDTPGARYFKEVLEHILATHPDTEFGYDDMPGDDKGQKSAVLVEMKHQGLRKSVGPERFMLTCQRDTKVVLKS